MYKKKLCDGIIQNEILDSFADIREACKNGFKKVGR